MALHGIGEEKLFTHSLKVLSSWKQGGGSATSQAPDFTYLPFFDKCKVKKKSLHLLFALSPAGSQTPPFVFSLNCLLYATSCWITQESLFWVILSQFCALLPLPTLTSRCSYFTVFPYPFHPQSEGPIFHCLRKKIIVISRTNILLFCTISCPHLLIFSK